VPLPPTYFVFLLFAVGTYLVLVEVVKARVMKGLFALGDNPQRTRSAV
jgi:hypothetical protein